MLEIDAVGAASADDYCFLFARHNAVGSLQQPPGTPWVRAELSDHFGEVETGLAIGRWAGRAAFAVALDSIDINPLNHVSGSLYTLLGRVDDSLFAAHGRALQLLNWRRDNRFCGRCGAPTVLGDRARAMVCEGCQYSRYPQLAPCAIVLVTRGSDLLLAQPAGRSRGFYSTLAGFIEPGESVEQSVVREVQEEVGIRVTDVRYFGSQPWPFPGQLMLGFTARYLDGEITPDPMEIADARWFSPDHLPPVPPIASISGQLIHHFLTQEAKGD